MDVKGESAVGQEVTTSGRVGGHRKEARGKRDHRPGWNWGLGGRMAQQGLGPGAQLPPELLSWNSPGAAGEPAAENQSCWAGAQHQRAAGTG